MKQENPLAPSLPTAEDVKRRRKPKRNINEQHGESLSVGERLALWITENIGTMGFFTIIFLWTAIWMGWHSLAQHWHLPGVFDRPWQFAIWLFISNLIQLHLMPLIMIGQNLQSRHAQMRADQEFHLTRQMEHETEIILRYLETLQQSVERFDERLGGLERRRDVPCEQ